MENKIKFQNARIMFKNFAGRETEFNDEGDRNFHVVIEDSELADQLLADGWNVKVRPPRDENETPLYHLPVKVVFGMYPPNVNLVSVKGVDSKGEPVYNVNPLNSETVRLIDDAQFECIDLIIRPYSWSKGGRSGITAYLNEFWGLIKENEFASKYSNRGEY